MDRASKLIWEKRAIELAAQNMKEAMQAVADDVAKKLSEELTETNASEFDMQSVKDHIGDMVTAAFYDVEFDNSGRLAELSQRELDNAL